MTDNTFVCCAHSMPFGIPSFSQSFLSCTMLSAWFQFIFPYSSMRVMFTRNDGFVLTMIDWLIEWMNEWIDCWYTLFSCPPCCLMDTFYLADKNLDAHGCQCFFFYSRKHNLCEHGYGTNAVVGSTSALEGIHLSSWSYCQLTGRQIQRYCDWSEMSILLQ